MKLFWLTVIAAALVIGAAVLFVILAMAAWDHLRRGPELRRLRTQLANATVDRDVYQKALHENDAKLAEQEKKVRLLSEAALILSARVRETEAVAVRRVRRFDLVGDN